MQSADQSKQKLISGEVVSNKVNGQVTIKVVRKYQHPKYGRVMHKSGKHIAVCEKKYELGEIVNFVPISKVSKTKAFKVVE